MTYETYIDYQLDDVYTVEGHQDTTLMYAYNPDYPDYTDHEELLND